jgi:hypothetical protein
VFISATNIWLPDDLGEFLYERAQAERRRTTQQAEYYLIWAVREAQQKSSDLSGASTEAANAAPKKPFPQKIQLGAS